MLVAIVLSNRDRHTLKMGVLLLLELYKSNWCDKNDTLCVRND